MRVVLGCLFLAITLCGCANHENDYLKESQQVGPVVVPPGVPSIKQSPYYPVPKHKASLPAQPVSLKPATMNTGM